MSDMSVYIGPEIIGQVPSRPVQVLSTIDNGIIQADIAYLRVTACETVSKKVNPSYLSQSFRNISSPTSGMKSKSFVNIGRPCSILFSQIYVPTGDLRCFAITARDVDRRVSKTSRVWLIAYLSKYLKSDFCMVRLVILAIFYNITSVSLHRKVFSLN